MKILGSKVSLVGKIGVVVSKNVSLVDKFKVAVGRWSWSGTPRYVSQVAGTQCAKAVSQIRLIPLNPLYVSLVTGTQLSLSRAR